jgi:hypothetical protein
VTRSTAMKRGRIEFYDDIGNRPRCQDCTVATTYYQRCFQKGGEVGGWWAIAVWDDARVRSSGPFPTLVEADRIGRQQADRLGCDYIPATPEEIAEAAEAAAEWARDAAAAGEAAS